MSGYRQSFPQLKLPLSVFFSTALVLSMIQWKVGAKMLLAERFISAGGWIEIVMVSIYGAIIAYKMQDQNKSGKWRLISWSVFSIWFFIQFFLGLLVSEKFLLTGKLHIPVPAMIISGPLFRGQLSVMTLLFISTIVLTGPAWCSHLCYFGALDGIVASKKKSFKSILSKNILQIKVFIVFITIFSSLVLRWIGTKPQIATILGALFGITGLLVIILYSWKTGKMFHCVIYCPVGTLVNYLKYINPFRIKIHTNCTACMKCSSVCKFDALKVSDIKKKKTGKTCTLCGDCINSCKENAIRYYLPGFSPEVSRRIYLFITITVHSIFLAMGRI